MSKKEFLKELESKLQLLEKQEIKDIIEEYDNHIEEKVKKGKTEEEAIEEFGDFDELVDEILSAYKINTKNVKKSNGFLDTLADELANFFKKLVAAFDGKTGDDLVRVICKFIIILIIISILRFPFALIKGLGADIFGNLPWFMGGTVSSVWRFIVELAYFVVAILMLYVSIKNLIFEDEDMEKAKNVSASKKSTSKKVDNKVEEVKNTAKDKTATVEERIAAVNNTNPKTGDPVLGPLSIVLKIFTVIFTIPGIFMVFGLMVAIGIMIALATQGVYLISLFFIMIGLLMITSSLLGMIYHVVFPKGGRR